MVGFPKKAVSLLRCTCKGELLIKESGTADTHSVTEGTLHCEKCKKEIRIHEGIVEYFPEQRSASAVVHDEMVARDKQATAYDERLAPRYHREVPQTLKLLGDTKGKRVIEYGCGTGRLTTHINDSELILAVDVSRESLNVLRKKLDGTKDIALVWADVVTLQTAPRAFDTALSAQVYEHITKKPERIHFLHQIRKTLKLRGRCVLSAYYYDQRRKKRGLPQTGQHASGSHYTYFSRRMLQGEFRMVFQRVKIRGMDFMFRGSTVLPPKLAHFFGQLPFFKNYAHLVVAEAENDHHEGVPHTSFKKYWFWFVPPKDIPNASLVNTFSYEKESVSGFHEREGLTSVINLSQPLENIWEGMRKKFVRAQIRKGERNGIVVKEGSHLFQDLQRLSKSFRERRGLGRNRISIFRHRSVIFVAYDNNRPIAGGLFISDGTAMRAYALVSARLTTGSGKERERIGQANRMVLWEALRFAHESRHQRFDLGGINPESSNTQLVRLAEFKEAFGGERCHNYYYYKVYSPLLRLWMRLRGLDV